MLREYQQQGLERSRAAFRAGARRVCLVAPTGAGKTRIGAEMLRLAGRGGWLAHRSELVAQAYDTLTGMGLRVSCLASDGIRPFDAGAPVQVASIQTLLARKQFLPCRFVIADEYHHFAGTTLADCLPDDARIVGLTATPQRGDGVGLHTIADRLITVSQIAPLVAAGYLAPIEVTAPPAKLKPGVIAQRPVDAYREHAPGRSAIVYSASLKMAAQHVAEFREAGIEAEMIEGGEDRTETLARFAAGDLRVVVNCQILTEGTDIPRADTAIIARGCGTPGMYLQIVGRIRRPLPGKTALLLDLSGASHEHGHPDCDRIYSLEGRGIRRKTDLVDQSYCRICGACTVPGQPCAECGAEARGIETKVRLTALQRYANMRQQAPDDRARNLAKWTRLAHEKGYSVKQPLAKYKALYGAWPSEQVIRIARTIR